MTPRRITFALLIVLLACMVAGAQRVLIDRRSVASGATLNYQTGLLVWHKPESLSGSNGDDVTQWNDSSGNNYHSYAPTGNEPMLTNSVLNGFPAVVFNADINSYFVVSNVFSALTEAEAFVVFKSENDPAASAAESGFWSFTSAGVESHVTWTDGNIYDAFGYNKRAAGNPSPDLSTAFRLYNVNFIDSSDGITNRIDTTQLAQVSGVTGNAAWNPTLKIGQDKHGAYEMCGWIVEVLIYDHSLDTTDRATVETYLDDKYSLTGY